MGRDTAVLDTGGDISEGGDLGELGVWKSTGDMRAGVVIADTYLCEHRIPPHECGGRRGRGREGKGTEVTILQNQRTKNFYALYTSRFLTLRTFGTLGI